MKEKDTNLALEPWVPALRAETTEKEKRHDGRKKDRKIYPLGFRTLGSGS